MLTVYSVECRRTGKKFQTKALSRRPTHCPHEGHEDERLDERNKLRTLTYVVDPSAIAATANQTTGQTTGQTTQGPKGDKGDQGEKGDKGDTGDAGYGMEIKHIFHSEQEVKDDACQCLEGEFAIIETGDANDSAHGRVYMCSGGHWVYMHDITCCHDLMRGARGPAGERGEGGCRGSRGTQGETGAGVQGQRGPNGGRGPQGDDGRQGTQGKEGQQGCGGLGEKGDQGDRGSGGTQGKEGKEGCRGEKGPGGDKGEQGEKGDPGPVCACRCSRDRNYMCEPQRPPQRHSGCCQTSGHPPSCTCVEDTHPGTFVGVYEGKYESTLPRPIGVRFLLTLLADGTLSFATTRQANDVDGARPVATSTGMWKVSGNFLHMNVISIGLIGTSSAGQMRRSQFKFHVTDGSFTEIGTGNAAGLGCERIFDYASFHSGAMTGGQQGSIEAFILFKHGVAAVDPSCSTYIN